MFFPTSRRLWVITFSGKVETVNKPPHMDLKYPRFYSDLYNQIEGQPSDRGFIEKRMAHIPAGEKQRVCEEYEKIHLAKRPQFRKKANEFLHKEATKYRR
jgi:hypothetical protein